MWVIVSVSLMFVSRESCCPRRAWTETSLTCLICGETSSTGDCSDLLLLLPRIWVRLMQHLAFNNALCAQNQEEVVWLICTSHFSQIMAHHSLHCRLNTHEMYSFYCTGYCFKKGVAQCCDSQGQCCTAVTHTALFALGHLDGSK